MKKYINLGDENFQEVSLVDIFSGVGIFSYEMVGKTKESSFKLSFDFQETGDIYADTSLKKYFRQEMFLHFVSSRRKDVLLRYVHETQKANLPEDVFTTICPIRSIISGFGHAEGPYYSYQQLLPLMPYIAEAYNYDSIKMGPRSLLYNLRLTLLTNQNGKELSFEQQTHVTDWINNLTAILNGYVSIYRRDLYVEACQLYQSEQESKNITITAETVKSLCNENKVKHQPQAMAGICRCLSEMDNTELQSSSIISVKVENSFKMIIQYKDPQKLLLRLHFLIDGKKGKSVGLVLAKAYNDKLITKIPSQKEFESEFKLNGSWKGIYNYTKLDYQAIKEGIKGIDIIDESA